MNKGYGQWIICDHIYDSDLTWVVEPDKEQNVPQLNLHKEIDQNGNVILKLGALRIGAARDLQPTDRPSNHPLIAFEHLSLYIHKHLGQSVAVRGILWKGRSWQTNV